MTETESLRLLCVNVDEREVPARRLSEAAPAVQTRHAAGTDEAIRALDGGNCDCVLVGESSDSDLGTTLERLTTTHPGVPVLLYGVSGPHSGHLEAGATDVVPAGAETAVFVRRVRNAVEGYRARRRAQERDRKLNSLLEHSSDRLSVLDEAGRYQFVSPAVERSIGHEPEKLLGTSAFEYVHPEDRERVRELFERIRDNPEATQTAEYRLRDADGDWRWLESRGINHLDDPAIEGIIVNSREVTERKTRERQLAEEQALTEAIFEALPDVFYAFDEEISFLRWNDRLSEVTGYDDEEIAGMHPAEFVVEEDRSAIYGAISRVVENDEAVTVEARFETEDGELIPYEFTGAKMTRDGETLGLVGIGRDISDRKERQRRFEAVFNNTYQFTGLMEPDGTIIEVNDTALAFGGLERSDVVGRHIWDAYWFQQSEQARETAQTAVQRACEGALFRSEVEVQGQEGPEIIDFSVRPLTDEHGDVRLLIPEGRTITDIKQRERHLGILHRFLRHNLRNKMTVIQGSADLLAAELTAPEHVKPVRQIQTAADELTELSETANKLSRVVTDADADRRPVDIQQLLRQVGADLREEYPDASVTVSAPVSREVRADWRLRTAFAQLVENGIEHTTDESPTVEISVTVEEDAVSVRVADDGPGIPEDELVGIVGEGEQTQLTHGTGFGLWLVRMVVDDYGGELSHESPPDGGSVVVVRLPTGPELGTLSDRVDGTDGPDSRRTG